MQYIYKEDNKSTLERLGRQATFKFQALWSVRDGKGLIKCLKLIFFLTLIYFHMAILEKLFDINLVKKLLPPFFFSWLQT